MTWVLASPLAEYLVAMLMEFSTEEVDRQMAYFAQVSLSLLPLTMSPLILEGQ